MEIENIIQYLLIGNLITGKIIYEMKNTSETKIINKIKNFFESYKMKLNLTQDNINVESYYINISLEKLIMISKTNANFSIEQSFELFENIIKNAPLLEKYQKKPRKKNKMQDLETRITNIIYDFFQYINANKQIISEAYFQNKSKFIINNFNRNNNTKIIKPRIINKVVTEEKNKSIDINKSSTREIINSRNIINKKNIEQIVLNPKVEEEDDINNITKFFYQSRKHNINNNNNINILTTGNQSTNTINFQKNTKKISKYKKFMILIICFIILIQIVAIPLIIINTYSY